MPSVWAASSASAISIPERKNRFHLHCPRANQMFERGPVEEFHDEICAPVFLANIVNRADVGMVERGCGLGLAAETIERLTILLQLLGKKLQRDEAAKPRVFGFINHAHAAAAKLFEDSVMGDGVVEQGE